MTYVIIHRINRLKVSEPLTEEQTEHIEKLLKDDKPIVEVSKYLNATDKGKQIQVVQAIPINVEEILQGLETIFG